MAEIAGDRALDFYRRLFGAKPSGKQTLDRGSLPTPLTYLSEQGLLTGRTRGDWVQVRCPAHKGGDEAHPSMGVSTVDGHFRCHTCGAKGGDIIALHRLITGMGFREAVADLGGTFHD